MLNNPVTYVNVLKDKKDKIHYHIIAEVPSVYVDESLKREVYHLTLLKSGTKQKIYISLPYDSVLSFKDSFYYLVQDLKEGDEVPLRVLGQVPFNIFDIIASEKSMPVTWNNFKVLDITLEVLTRDQIRTYYDTGYSVLRNDVLFESVPYLKFKR